MKILVAAASRQGSTAEIADRIAANLRQAHHDVDLIVAEPGRWLDDEHDGYVVGSAVYYGRWLRGARRFLEENTTILRRHPVWLFSTGPTDAATKESIGPQHVDALMTLSGARSHAIFGGRLRRSELAPFQRLVVRMLKAPDGDAREWDAIDRWTTEIAAALASAPVTSDAEGSLR